MIAEAFKLDVDVVKNWPIRKTMEHLAYLRLKRNEEKKVSRSAEGKGVYKHDLQFR